MLPEERGEKGAVGEDAGEVAKGRKGGVSRRKKRQRGVGVRQLREERRVDNLFTARGVKRRCSQRRGEGARGEPPLPRGASRVRKSPKRAGRCFCMRAAAAAAAAAVVAATAAAAESEAPRKAREAGRWVAAGSAAEAEVRAMWRAAAATALGRAAAARATPMAEEGRAGAWAAEVGFPAGARARCR